MAKPLDLEVIFEAADPREQWRYKQLKLAGYDEETAALLTLDPSVDLHRAVDLLGDGCSVAMARKILL